MHNREDEDFATLDDLSRLEDRVNLLSDLLKSSKEDIMYLHKKILKLEGLDDEQLKERVKGE